jgi:hypothetical protein
MKARTLYRISAGLILLFAMGHSSGFPWSDPSWGVDTGPMRSRHFVVLGANRSYWDFYVGFGLDVSVFLVLASIITWELGSLSPTASPFFRATVWALPLGFAVITVLSCLYFFVIPIVFSTVITVCLFAAAALSPRTA